MANKDNIFATPRDHVGDFCFDDAVADVFPDMINRSVPGYQTIIDTIGELGQAYVTPDSNVFDLGCSLGAASLSVARHCPANQCNIYAIDSSEAMVKRCQRVVDAFHLPNAIHVSEGYAQSASMSNASMVIMNFTMQFIAPDERREIVKRVYDGLNPGGIFVLSEKVQHEQEAGNALINTLHLNFKRNNGYSELEISQKRAALENVMLIDSFSTHEERLRSVGFSDVVMWYKCYNFMSLVAIK